MTKHKKVVTLLYDWDTMFSRAQRGREKDTTSTETNTIEHLFLVSSEPLKVPIKPRVGYAGDSSSTGVGPVRFASADVAMKMNWATKKKAFDTCLRKVGGPGPDQDKDKTKAPPRKDSDIEVAFFHAMGHEWHPMLP